MSLLDDPNDFAFLIGGLYKSPETVSHLEEVVSQCKDTTLAKWCAARLGLEYFKEFQNKYPSIEKFKTLRNERKFEEPLFNSAQKYLELTTELPNEFPICEEVISNLVRIEYIDGNYKKAISLLDELNAKYPKGKYGRRAAREKQELLELQKRRQKQD